MFSWCQSHLKYRYFGSPKQQESSKAAMQHSESPIKQLSSQQGVGRGRTPSQAGAKPAAKLDIKKSSRARSILSNFLPSPRLQGNTKITNFCTQIPRCLDITITYYLLCKSYVFMVPKPPKISIFWYPKTTGKQ